jgi:hypothetical protein
MVQVVLEAAIMDPYIALGKLTSSETKALIQVSRKLGAPPILEA